MSAKRLEDLEAWQLAMDVKRSVFALAHRGPALRDRRFREDLLASAGAISKNIGEGFGRYRPAEFANKLRIALGELYETDTALIHGFESGYFTQEDVDRVRQVIERATKVASRLHTYLDNCARQGLYKAPAERQASNRAGRRGLGVNGKNDER